MSDAASAVRMGLATAIRDTPVTTDVALYLADPPPGLLPRIEVQEPIAADWGAKDWQGRELRTAVVLRGAQGQAERLASMQDAIEAAGADLSGDMAGWRVASACFLRSRTMVADDGMRSVLIEHRIRVSKIEGE